MGSERHLAWLTDDITLCHHVSVRMVVHSRSVFLRKCLTTSAGVPGRVVTPTPSPIHLVLE